MPSPGPTDHMLARQVRMGDVVYLADDEIRTIRRVVWLDSIGGQPLVIGLVFDDGTTLSPLDPDDPLDVTRPFARHDAPGDHDTPETP
jgi:hypothetical protein